MTQPDPVLADVARAIAIIDEICLYGVSQGRALTLLEELAGIEARSAIAMAQEKR